ncbi:MAG TPA: FAD/NAD(P)-binding oxidoreductase [Pyrinomonadaceae bacterium]|jgi:NADPH-dependent 2,4-dienoyl-CoA reductase/sulfur reductase-like enzyme|nr:FAD/NAD(P)-binding oxidoreductase [Pyrinomonadaceae bacterium]
MSRKRYECDVLIVGAGPAGLAAVYRVTQNGRKATVVDDNPDAGGQIWRGEQRKTTSPEAATWFEKIRNSRFQFINGARVYQQPEQGILLAEMAQGSCELKYQTLILATGARERFLPFPGWTLPNVFGAGGLQALVKSGLPIEGKKVVIAGSGPLLLAVADYLRRSGADVLLIAEQATRARLARFGFALIGQTGKASQAMKLKRQLSGIPYLTGSWPVAAHGEDRLNRITLRRGSKTWDVNCDYLACGFHLVPNLELAELLDCGIKEGAVSVDEFQQTSVANVYCVGEATGIGGLELSLVEGEIAGLAAAGQQASARELFRVRDKQRKFALMLNRTFELREELKSLVTQETIVCRCEDVTFDRLQSSESWRAAKLHTRCGMGPCQGRICGAAAEFLLGWKAESVRPPVFPVRVGSMTSD